MSTSTTSAIRSRKARENLIRLLFQAQDDSAAAGKPGLHLQRRNLLGATSTISNTVNTVDFQRGHSYPQLRAAYLEKVHAMHPDKVAALHQNGPPSKDLHLDFIELKNAWEEYHASVRIAQRRCNDSSIKINNNLQDEKWKEDESFTMFGVGCSFADSPEERDLRHEITEQACRGWLPSGSISYPEYVFQQSKSNLSQKQNIVQHLRVGLSDNDMFVLDEQPMTKKDCANRKHLVQNVDKFKKKR